MGVQENKANARRFLDEVMNRGNLDAVDELMGPRFVDHTAPPGVPEGAEGFKSFVTAFRAAVPDLQYTVEDELADGDTIVDRVRATGTMQGDFLGMPASGRSATWEEIHITRYEDGRAAEHWGVVDQLGMLVQLGFAQAPGQPAGVTG
ncbi:MAG TPA: ester cyclase [Candidatus Limnocylindrales bacterium]|nr:ester cyclase [Candidatus Limnocylindrales bacterium]